MNVQRGSSSNRTVMTFLRDRDNAPALVIGAAFFLLEWLGGLFTGYGFFGDELYYLSCAARPAAGYIDHPPLSVWILTLITSLGSPLWVVRLCPALAGGVSILVAACVSAECGGKWFARSLSAGASAAAPVLGVVFGFYSMNALEFLIVGLLVLLLVRLDKSENPRWWLAFGAMSGLALMNKHTAILYVGALAAFFFFHKRYLVLTKWTLAGVAVSLLIFLPNLSWETTRGWPSIEFYKNATLYKNIDSPIWKVLLDQILGANPFLLPLFAGGISAAFRRSTPLSFAVRAYLALLAALALSGSSRPDRIAALLPAVFAAGALNIETFARTWPRIPVIAIIWLTFAFLALMPVSFPLLPPEHTAAYAARLGVVPKIERGRPADLPQWFADRLGWEIVAAAVEKTQSTLGVQEAKTSIIVTSDYGYAGALERYAKGLVPVVSGHNSWYLWNRPAAGTTTAILVGFRAETMREFCGRLETAGIVDVPFRRRTEILICRKPREPFAQAWPQFRHFE